MGGQLLVKTKSVASEFKESAYCNELSELPSRSSKPLGVRKRAEKREAGVNQLRELGQL